MALNAPTNVALLAAVLLSSCSSLATELRSRANGYEVQVLAPYSPARTFHHRGETWVLGQLGERYVIRVSNNTGARVEAVVAVDGRDVVDGKPADFATKRGYLIPAWGHVDIEGFRVSGSEVAAFRFSRVADSYAARTGSARNVGVIGVAMFPERPLPPPPPAYPLWQTRSYDDDPNGGYGRRSEAEAPAAAAPAAPGGGSAASERPASRKAERPGLGTEFGEAMTSRVQEVPFERANSTHPAALIGMRYNDRDGLIAQGIDVDGPRYPSDSALRRTADPFPGSSYAKPPPGWRR